MDEDDYNEWKNNERAECNVHGGYETDDDEDLYEEQTNDFSRFEVQTRPCENDFSSLSYEDRIIPEENNDFSRYVDEYIKNNYS